MTLDAIRKFCLSLAHATEDVKWEHDLVFSVGKKMFAVVCLEPPHTLSFKCTPEEFNRLIEIEGIIPAPYVARYHWVQLASPNVLAASEIKTRVQRSYRLVHDKLPRKVRETL